MRVIATRTNAPDSAASTETTGTPQSPPPGAPSGVAVTPGQAALTVSWNAVSGASGYKVQWKSGSEMYNTSSRQATTTATTYTITGLTVGTTYTVRVIATHLNAPDGAASAERDGIPWQQAAVNGVTIASTPAASDTYGLGERIEVQVQFTAAVVVRGAPQLALAIDTQTRQADYASGTGTTSISFRYVVAATDADPDGISIGASALALNGGTINDARDATVPADLPLGANAIANAANHKVDSSIETAPAVAEVAVASSPSPGGAYVAGSEIRVRVTFDRPVDVTGTPQLALAIDTARQSAAYVSGSGVVRSGVPLRGAAGRHGLGRVRRASGCAVAGWRHDRNRWRHDGRAARPRRPRTR